MSDQTMIHPVILCGGAGTRLWPLSRKSYPKQFSKLLGAQSLFQASAERFSAKGYAPPLILTAEPFRFIVLEQLAASQIVPSAVLIEPEGRNTAPAILAAALWLAENAPEALMLVAPSDHVIPDAAAFRATVARAVPRAQAGDLVTFGIRPDRPETGYGYLEAEPGEDPGKSPRPLRRFIEKPDSELAASLIATGDCLWNAGIFLFSVATILAAYSEHAPQLVEAVADAVSLAETDLGFARLASEPWARAEDISIDYAIMEKASNLSVMPYEGRWSDLGGWEAVWHVSGPDPDGNVCAGPSMAIDCRDTLLRSESPGLQLVGLGLEDIVAVAMPDAVLVARKSEGQRVKEAVAALREREILQAEAFPVDHRPWGWFESLALGDRFQVKRIVVKPGAALSLQAHHHRAEHWIVVAGTAKVTVGEDVRLVPENESVFIPLGAKHRLENPGKLPVVLIEVQTGAYLGEDDIIRFEDLYARD